jgi:NTE family protein
MAGLKPLLPLEASPGADLSHGPSDLGLVMGGGGARAAYQVGFLRCLARRFPELHIPYITGVSAGALNAAMLASHHGTFLQSVQELSELWGNLTVGEVFRVDTRSLALSSMRWLKQLSSGGIGAAHSQVRGLVDYSAQPRERPPQGGRHQYDKLFHGLFGDVAAGNRYRRMGATAATHSSGYAHDRTRHGIGCASYALPGSQAGQVLVR